MNRHHQRDRDTSDGGHQEAWQITKKTRTRGKRSVTEVVGAPRRMLLNACGYWKCFTRKETFVLLDEYEFGRWKNFPNIEKSLIIGNSGKS